MRPLPDYVQRDVFDIPYIENDTIDLSGLNNSQWLINMKNASPSDKYADKKIVHSFCYDDVLNRAYNNPVTISVRDIILGDTISGAIRLIESLFIAGGLAVGFWSALFLFGG